MERDSKDEVLFAAVKSQSSRVYALTFSLVAVVGWGLYAYLTQLSNGLGVTGMRSVVSWGFYVITFVFFIGISHVGALMSAILRLTNSDWRRPVTRLAEVVTFASLLVAAALPLIDLGRPDRILYIALLARLQSPLVWDFMAIGTDLTASVIFLYLPMIPDIAACRDRLENVSWIKKRAYKILSLGWHGTEAEFARLERLIKIMTILIIPIAISVHTVVSWDFAMTLRTGWNSTIFGPYFVGGALFSGVATVIVVMAVLTKFYHLESYITKKHFDYMAKLLLALNIILIYLTINEFMVPGYKSLQQSDMEGQWMASLLWGQFAYMFWFQLIIGLIMPAALIAVPKTRTIMGYLLAGLLADVGMWVERFNIVAASLAVPQLNYSPGIYVPSWVELSILAAAFAGFTLIYLVFTRIFPIVSVWENKDATGPTTPPRTVTMPKAVSPLVTRTSGTAQVSGLPSETTTGDGPKSTSRREFLKFGLLGAGGFGVGLLAGPAVAKSLGISTSPTKANGATHTMVRIPLSNLGNSTSLSAAETNAGFSLSVPTSLPSGTSLSDVRVPSGGKLVTLLYGNPSIESLSIYQGEVAILISQSPDTIVDAIPSYLPQGYVRLNVGSSPGFARSPFESQKMPGMKEPGQLQWWKDGVRYSIFSNLTVDQMTSIAQSMKGAN